MAERVFIGYAHVNDFLIVKVWSNGTTSGDLECVRLSDGRWFAYIRILNDHQSSCIERVYRDYTDSVLADIMEKE